MLKKPFVALWIIFCLTPVFSHAQTAAPQTVGEADARLNELRRGNEALKNSLSRVRQSSANDSLVQERKRLFADVELPLFDVNDPIYEKNFQKAKQNFIIGKECGTDIQQSHILYAATSQLMSDPDVRVGNPFPGGRIRIICTITNNNAVGGGGHTAFKVITGQKVFDFNIAVHGSLQRILDSIITHEVAHCVTAAKCKRKVPRCLDEGICGMMETQSERLRQYKLLNQSIASSRGKKAGDLPIPVSELLSIMEYPQNKRNNYELYAEGTALNDFIVLTFGQGFPKQLNDRNEAQRLILNLINEAYGSGWDAALQKYSDMLDVHNPDISSVDALSVAFKAWIKNGYVLPNAVIQAGGASRP